MGRRVLAASYLAVAALACAAPDAGAGPVATAARSCAPGNYPGDGYFESLHVTNVTCATGRRVELAHYRCRTRNGPAGRCYSRVLRYRCSEQRFRAPGEIDGRVTCRRGSRKVVYAYQQFL